MKSEKGIVLIVLYVFVFVLVVLMASLYAMSSGEIHSASSDAYLIQAFYLAEAGIDKQLADLNNGGSTSVGSFALGSGNASVVFDNDGSAIVSTGTVNDFDGSVTITVTVENLSLSVNVDSALRCASNLTTNGSITIDGRDHYANGNLNGDPGVYGIVTTATTYTQSGSSKVGGNGAAPAKPYNPVAVKVHADPFPTTPEEILGLEPGSLDAYKTSTPPGENFSGIVYYTGDAWNPVNFGTFSSGILIVHNADADALMKNVHGNFNGIIITDELEHLNGDMVVNGAILTTSQDGNVIGNGTAIVNYSSEVLANLKVPIYKVTSWKDQYNT